MASHIPPPGAMMGSAPPPPGIVPNLIDPPRNEAPWNSTIVCLVLVVACVVVRFFTKSFLVKAFGWDDCKISRKTVWMMLTLTVTCLLALLFVIATAVTNFELIKLGLGTDLWNIPFGQFNILGWERWNYVQNLVYFTGLGLVKISILLLYLKIFQVRERLRYLIFAMVGFVAVFTFVGIFVTIFACKPINTLWDMLPYGTCLNTASVGITFAALQLFIDAVILAIPVVPVMSLQLAMEKKIAVMVVFLAGILATIASCVRLAYLVQAVNDPLPAMMNPTMALANLNLWSTIELDLALMISCMPSFKAFFMKLTPWLKSTRKASSGQTSPMQTNGSKFLRGGRPREADDSIDGRKSWYAIKEESTSVGEASSGEFTV